MMVDDTAPRMTRTMKRTTAVTECLNYLLDIIQPPLRAVSKHVLTLWRQMIVITILITVFCL